MTKKNAKREAQSRRLVEGEVSLRPGTRYTKEGISVDIDAVKDCEVYVRRWPKGVKTQSFFSKCKARRWRLTLRLSERRPKTYEYT